MQSAEEFLYALTACCEVEFGGGLDIDMPAALALIEQDRAATKREAFEQVSRELTAWAAQHVDAGFPELEKTILGAAKTYADKAAFLK